MTTLTLAAAAEDVAARLFGGSGSTDWRIGAEVEVIPLRAADLKPAPVESDHDDASTLPWLRSIARELDWRESKSAYGVPSFKVPSVGVLAYEPGGQLELSTVPMATPSAMLDSARRTLALLHERAGDAGLLLLELGIDPINDESAAPLRFPTRRYSRMAAYFERIGPAGARMMRQTASSQLSVDVAPADVAECWSVFNGVAPVLIATFANSRSYGGRRTPDASARARVWQQLDPSRTGVLRAVDFVTEYATFALDAPAFLLDDAARPMRECVKDGSATAATWQEHLSTLFPEVRPRGYFEIRGCDMVGDDARAAMAAVVHCIATSEAGRTRIGAVVCDLNGSAYRRAPRGDGDLVSRGDNVLRIAVDFAKAQPRDLWSSGDVDLIERFIATYPARGRVPADDAAMTLLQPADGVVGG